LIQHSIEQALSLKTLEGVYVSTDDVEIAESAKKMGARVPRLRSPEYADDQAPLHGALLESLSWPELQGVEALLILQPTSPLRTLAQCRHALELFEQARPDAVVSVVKVPHAYSPASVMELAPDSSLTPFLKDRPTATRRQDKPTVYSRSGPAVLVLSAEFIRRCGGLLFSGRTLGFEIPLKNAADIDEPEDLEYAEWLLSRRAR
jgi:CMP-N-acetylneuraminic acid synthetase